MNWYYLDTQQQQVGPLSDAEMQNLVSKGVMKKSTMVWNESMAGWLSAAQTPINALFPATTPPPSLPVHSTKGKVSQEKTAGFIDPSVGFGRDEALVYPPNPPRSQHMSWLNLLCPGLAQIVFGKTWMGISAIAAINIINLLLNLIKVALGNEDPNIMLLLIILFLIAVLTALYPASIVDAFMTGNRLSEGQPVGKWQLFPRNKK